MEFAGFLFKENHRKAHVKKTIITKNHLKTNTDRVLYTIRVLCKTV